MFSMDTFVKENLIEGYLTKSFNKTQINIFSLNYLRQGMIDQETFEEITKFIEENEPYPDKESVEEVEENEPYPEEEEDEEPPKE
ncbi:hypothetical protein [Tetragenococcus halophilus]|uniref:hypothetical protein n=1 Tax=Tetragenococcus halophilus TaxID=51669 RepID=UPI0015B7E969|nr:hypothetical protein [Tetragenococcus halophilus]NWO01272.1 hypothetical protein [Tetragenococcus halophilus]